MCVDKSARLTTRVVGRTVGGEVNQIIYPEQNITFNVVQTEPPTTMQRQNRRYVVLLLVARATAAARLRPSSCVTGSYYLDGEVNAPRILLASRNWHSCNIAGRPFTVHLPTVRVCALRPPMPDARACPRGWVGLLRGLGALPPRLVLRLGRCAAPLPCGNLWGEKRARGCRLRGPVPRGALLPRGHAGPGPAVRRGHCGGILPAGVAGSPRGGPRRVHVAR